MNRPLTGCRVLLTRPAAQAAAWRTALQQAGAEVVDYPTTRVDPPPSWEPLDRALADLTRYDWLVFSSAAAVHLAEPRFPAGLDRGAMARPRTAAVGEETARALRDHGFRVDRVPVDQRQEGLAASFSDLTPGARVLFPRALDGREHLIVALRALGVEVDVVPASQTVAVAHAGPPPGFDVATFASPSALGAFVERLGTGMLAAVPLVVIGATTAAAAQSFGLRPVQARAPNIAAVIDAIASAMAPQGDP